MSKKADPASNLKQKNNSERKASLIRQAFGDPSDREAVLREILSDQGSAEAYRSFSEDDRERVLAYLAGEKTLQILCDRFFQKVLSPREHPERMQSLLSAIFGQEAEIVEVLSREGMMVTEEGGQMVMDVIVRLRGGELVNVEMQRIGYYFPGERSSCYLADMTMRQYGMLKERSRRRGEEFSYRGMKPVYLVVIMDRSAREFREASPACIHRRVTSYSSGARVAVLENVVYVSLDTFRERGHNEIETELDAWLAFFTAEAPGDVLGLLGSHPEFLPLYNDIAEFRRSPREVVGMFSEELRIMDRNTMKYMIDDMKQEAENAKQEAENAKQEAETAKQELQEAKQQAENVKREAKNAKQEVETAKQEVKTAKQEVETAKQEVETAKQEAETAKQELQSLKQENDELRKRLSKYEKL